MELSPEAQKVLNDLLVVLIPVVTSIISAWFVGWKNRRDTDAAFKKIRAHEDYLGIKTDQKGEIHVSSSTSAVIKSPASQPPQGLGEGQGPSGAA